LVVVLALALQRQVLLAVSQGYLLFRLALLLVGWQQVALLVLLQVVLLQVCWH
jgi:hypothetical protein